MFKLLFAWVLLVLVATAAAEDAPVPLRASVVVHGEKLLLSDFLPAEAPGSLRTRAAMVSLGRAPAIGMVRVLSRAELESRLRPELVRELGLPETLEARRPAYRITTDQVKAALEPDLRALGAAAPVRDFQLEVQPVVDTPEPHFRILEISRDPLRHRWNARVAVEDAPQVAPFLVSLPASESLNPLPSHPMGPPARPALRVRTGQVAQLRIDDASFHVSISVVCLENGVPGAEIRVRDRANGKIHYARITEAGELQWLGEHDELR